MKKKAVDLLWLLRLRPMKNKTFKRLRNLNFNIDKNDFHNLIVLCFETSLLRTIREFQSYQMSILWNRFRWKASVNFLKSTHSRKMFFDTFIQTHRKIIRMFISIVRWFVTLRNNHYEFHNILWNLQVRHFPWTIARSYVHAPNTMALYYHVHVD